MPEWFYYQSDSPRLQCHFISTILYNDLEKDETFTSDFRIY